MSTKAKLTEKLVPNMIRARPPKETVPLMLMMRQKKKEGGDVAAMIAKCMGALET
jgi:hypothetical protein